jgi:hypothetical protein
MLLNITPAMINPFVASILAAIGQGQPPETIAPGITLVRHFNHEDVLPADQDFHPHSSGVCDNYQQILDAEPELLAEGRAFVIVLTEIRHANQSSDGGWRWHKWGEYIGTHDIQCEYLYDEVGIEVVYYFTVFEAHPE